MFSSLHSAIYTVLSGALSSLVVDRIYALQAPAAVLTPYVVFAYVSGGAQHSSPRLEIDILFRITCVADDHATALTGFQQIETAFNSQPLVVSGWTVLPASIVDWFNAVSNREGEQFYEAGVVVRLRAIQN